MIVNKRCDYHYACVRYAVEGGTACEGCPRAGDEVLTIDHPEECGCPWCLEMARNKEAMEYLEKLKTERPKGSHLFVD